MLEIELKLAIPPAHAAAVWTCTAIRSRLRATPDMQNLYTVYYDTPELEFLRRGVAVRLRREGRKWIQTVKSDARSSGGLHRHHEFEMEVPAQSLDFALLRQAGCGRLIARDAQRKRVAALFATRFRRQRALLELSGSRIEVAVDRGLILAGTRRAAISEVELELKAGEPDALFALARGLLHDLPLRLEPRTKAQRGYLLATGQPERPVKAAPIALDPGLGVDEAFMSIVNAGLHHLQANERGAARAHDPEYLHQTRVALRRLRAAFGVFSPAVPKSAFQEQIEALKQLAGHLGEARDWDVFVSETLPRAQAAAAAFDLTPLKKRAMRAGSAAQRAARAALEAQSCTMVMLDLTQRLWSNEWRESRSAEQRACAGQPLAAFVRRVLDEKERRLHTHASAIASRDAAALHRLRIDAKKLRYGCQFFASLFNNRKADAYIERLADLQDILGKINDMASAMRLDERLSAGARPSLQGALAYVDGFSAGSLQELAAQLAPVWKRLQRTDSFWKKNRRNGSHSVATR